MGNCLEAKNVVVKKHKFLGISYKTVGNLLCWIFPTKEDKRNFRYFCREIDERSKIATIQNRYLTTITRLKNKYNNKEKIKVVFLNDTIAKWQYQPLYDELKNNPNFDVQVLVTVQNYYTEKKMQGLVDHNAEAKRGYEFFASQGMNVDYAFDLEKCEPIDLRKFSPDIIFYEQPWALFKIHNIEETSKFALTCYSSYGSNIGNGKEDYGSIFYKELFKYFIDNEYMKLKLMSHGAFEESLVVSGHPKLDNYIRPIKTDKIHWKSVGKKRVIYAPHFSFYGDTVLHFGTFDKNGKFILEFARKHPEIEFIFKPHPRLKEDIVRRGLMSEAERDEYYNTWATLPNTQLFDSGNYIDMFRASDAMITDCDSFLYEYLPTKKPVLHLIANDSVGFNPYGNKIISAYYPIRDMDKLISMLSYVLLEGQDVLKNKREQIVAKELYQPEEGYAKFVTKQLEDLLTNEKEGRGENN